LKTTSAVAPALFVFKPEVLFDPTAYNGDASDGLQAAIDAIATAPLSKGGVLFIKPGTYTLTKTVKLAGTGIALVGTRDVIAPGVWGPYPTFRYGDHFFDPDYDPGSTNAARQRPAVFRVNGNTDYSTAGKFSFNGLHGLNVECVASGSSTGALATALGLHLVHLSTFRDLTITNAHAGVSIVDSTTPSFHNLRILGLRGDWGIRCGDPESDALKVQGLEITAAPGNTNATLVFVGGNTELVGADLRGGRIGLDISGRDPTNRASNLFLRSIRISEPAEQGVRVGYAVQVYITDLEIVGAGREAFLITTNFYGGLALANLRAVNSGFSALRVQRGMNISVVNAELLNSGQRKAAATPADLPIAGLWLNSGVTSFSLVGARIGSQGVANEDWGVYASTNPPAQPPWHEPVWIVQNLDWWLPPERRAFGVAVGPGSHEQLVQAGYFAPPAGDSWASTATPPNSPPALPGWRAPARGFNLYDLPELRDRPWIDLSSPALYPLVVPNGTDLNAEAFATLLAGIAADARFTNGVVLYLPAGKFTNASFTAYTRRIYRLDRPLMVDRPNVQLLGDGRDVTQIYCTPFAETNDHALKLVAGSAGSGIYGLAVYHERTNLLRTNWPAGTAFKAPFRIEHTGNVRLAATSVRYSMGGAYSLFNVTNALLYDCLPLSLGVNNSQPTAPLAAFWIEGAGAPDATADIQLYQCVGNFFPNIWLPAEGRFCGWNPDGTRNLSDVDSAACYLPTDTIPNLDWVRLVGGVQRVRLDYCTFLQGKNGLVTVASGGLVPRDVSTFKFATDHNFDAMLWLQQLVNGDFVGNWTANRRIGVRIEPDVSGALRFFNQPMRGSALEGFLIQGGSRVALVNCQVGNNSQLWPGVSAEGRPFAGIYLGNTSGSNVVVGGQSGWLFNANYERATINPGDQDWGIVLAAAQPTNSLTLFGVNLFGNGGPNARNPASPPGFQRGLGWQTNSGVAWLTDGPNFNATTTNGLPWTWLEQYGLATDGSADFADPDDDGMSTAHEYRAGTNPTNALSRLAIVSVQVAGGGLGPVTLEWLSASNVFYTVERATNLQAGFDSVAGAHLPATPPRNTFTDTNPATAPARFYRVRVE